LDHLDTVAPPELRGSERKGLPKSRARSNDSYARAATFSKRLPS
jgi:hypothetical protein